jgi:dTDP-4-dehydrorhamnose reductase
MSARLRFMIMAVDLLDTEGVHGVFERAARPDLVIHTAAVGSVDFAKKNLEITYSIEVGGPQTVVDLYREFGARLSPNAHPSQKAGGIKYAFL